MTETILDLPHVRVCRCAPEVQWLLHARPEDAQALAAAAGLALPDIALTSAIAGGWTALHLSPDEWLLVGADGNDGAALAPLLDATGLPHSLVDISDRSLALIVEGASALDTLAGACPLDLERLPDGCCTRTLFGKVTVLLRRIGAGWRIEHARSFDLYVTTLLTATAHDAAETAPSV